MAIDFPASPTVGQVFVVGSVTYTWDGTKWKSNATNSPFSLGSASTPSITFIGDSNTGIYSPGADQLAISTNGTGRLFIDANGNVGVNTSTPVSFGAGYRTIELKGTTGGGVFRSTGDTTTVDLYAESGAGGLGVLRTLTNHPFAFYTNSLERLRITAAGLVGIGTSSPRSTLTVAGQYSIDNNTTDPNDGAAYLFQQGGVGWNLASTNIAFSTGGSGSRSERARIDSSGRLLVGTSSDTSGGNGNALLQVVSSGPGRILPGRSDGSTAADLAIGAVDFRSFAGSAWESVATITAFSDGVSGSGDKPGRLVFSTTADGASSPTERLRITNAGRVGVGQTSPATTLDLSGAYSSNVVAVGALDIDCSVGNYFTKTINANSTFTFSNPPGSRSYGFTLELTHTSGTVTWPAAVQWPGGTAPTLTTGKVHLFIFVTDDGGTIWRGSSLINYNS